jgi:hypothetical protein
MSVKPDLSTLSAIGHTEFGNGPIDYMACTSLLGKADGAEFLFAQLKNNQVIMISMPQSYLPFRHGNVAKMVMRSSSFGINISQPTQKLTAVGNMSNTGDIYNHGNMHTTGKLYYNVDSDEIVVRHSPPYREKTWAYLRKSKGPTPFAHLKTKRVPLEAQERSAKFCGSYFLIGVDSVL